jgi:PAS domain S-box-containing protein
MVEKKKGSGTPDPMTSEGANGIGSRLEIISAFMDATTERFVILDAQLNFLDVNQAVVNATGLKKEELIGRTLAVAMPEAEKVGRVEKYLAVLQTGKTYEFASSYLSQRFDRRVYVESTVFRVSDNMLGLIIHDVSKCVEAELARTESEGRYRHIVETISDRLWETDSELRITRMDGGGEDQSKIFVGKMITDLEIVGIESEDWREHLARLAKRESFRDMRQTIVSPDGQTTHTRVSGSPFYDEDGEFAGYRGVTVYETAKVAAMLRAQEAERALEEAIATISDGLIIYDKDENFVRCNAAYRKMFPELEEFLIPGVSRSGLRDRFETIVGVHTDASLQADRTEGSPPRASFFEEYREVERTNGEWVRAIDHRLSDGGVVGIRTDITEFKRREEEIRSSQETLSAFMESATGTIAILDQDLNYLGVNELAARNMGMATSEIIGCNILEISRLTNSGDRSKEYLEVLRTGQPYSFETSGVRVSTGEPLHISGTGFRIGEDRLGIFRILRIAWPAKMSWLAPKKPLILQVAPSQSFSQMSATNSGRR